jgi:hypothetical protein
MLPARAKLFATFTSEWSLKYRLQKVVTMSEIGHVTVSDFEHLDDISQFDEAGKG